MQYEKSVLQKPPYICMWLCISYLSMCAHGDSQETVMSVNGIWQEEKRETKKAYMVEVLSIITWGSPNKGVYKKIKTS